MLHRTKLGAAALGAAMVAALIGWLLLAGRPGPAKAPGRDETPQAVPARPASPSETLSLAVEAAAQGQSERVLRYFADPTAAQGFMSALGDRLPAGKALVARADQVDAGAGEGHAVPVTVWVDGPGAVTGLQGEARFSPTPEGHRIRELWLAPVTLKVSSWAAASRKAPGLRRDDNAAFYGRFRFTDGRRRVAIDALTGAVEEE